MGKRRSGLPEWAPPALSVLTYFLLRLPGLLALPIFCDESVYLRYAQLIARAPISRALLSVVDPKPPLHYWLLALVLRTTSDPLLAARLLSVVAGAVSVLVLFPLSRELAGLARGAPGEKVGSAPTPGTFAVAASALFVACPFLAFYQRLALAEAILVLEALLVAWLSLRWAMSAASAASAGGPAARFRRETLALGLALCAALLTKQNFSYVLFGLPILAVALRSRRDLQPSLRRLALGFLGILAVSILLFLPYLLVQPGPPLRDRLFYRATHGDFGGGIASHARIAWDNWRYVFIPMTETHVEPVAYEGFRAPADAGWLWIYLTPPIFLLAVAGIAALAWRKENRLLGFLGGWTLLALLPFLLFATTAVPRYALTAVPPLLLAAAYLLDRMVRGIRGLAAGAFAGRAAAAVVILALLAWPLVSIADQDTRWDRQRLVRADRWQYVSGWPCGLASRRAVDFLRALAAANPIVVITTESLGTPNDVVWTYLDRTRNVSLFFAPWALEAPILRPAPGRPDRFFLNANLHDLWYRKEVVSIRPDVPILFVSMDPYPGRDGKTVPAESLLRPRNREMREIARFENIPMDLPHRVDSVVVYELRS
jgi:4-amino-4-deoxy-L-arabinose transferase-like glycosyltransferase